MSVSSENLKPRTIRSYVRREGRLTAAQERALETGWPRFGIEIQNESPLDLANIFGREQPRILEIGYGNGDCLFHAAKMYPQYDFIGIEVYRPGIGRLCQRLIEANLTNVRLIQIDAVDVLARYLPQASLTGIHIFFPDPWPKKRHHKRRLIQEVFIQHAAQCIKPQGYLHLATDWADYAGQMQEIVSANPHFSLVTQANPLTFERPKRVNTRFEARGQRLGHEIFDLIYCRSNNP